MAGGTVAFFLSAPILAMRLGNAVKGSVVIARAVVGVVWLRRERSRWLAGGQRPRGWIILARILAGVTGAGLLYVVLIISLLSLVCGLSQGCE